jgi:hypothetical protein
MKIKNGLASKFAGRGEATGNNANTTKQTTDNNAKPAAYRRNSSCETISQGTAPTSKKLDSYTHAHRCG